MKYKYKYLVKNILLFAINGFIPKIVAVILIPIYTKYLSTYEYGLSDLIIITVQLLLPIFTLDIQDAVMRFTMDKEHNKSDVFSVAIRIILCGSVGIFLISIFISILKIPEAKSEYLFCVGLLFLANALYNTCSMFCRGIEKVEILVGASSVNSLVLVILNIILLVYFNTGLVGYVFSIMFGKCCAIIYMCITGKLYKYIKIRGISLKTEKQMLAFSFPLIFSVVAWWVNSASDRYIITWLKGASISGIYAMAYTIPNILSIFQNILSQAWTISAIKDYDPNDTDGFIVKTYEMMNMGMVIMTSIIMSLNIYISKVLFSFDFFEARKYVPLLLIAVLFNALGLFIGGIFTSIKETKTLAYSTVLGAVINTIFNLILIKEWGAYGAAVATIIGYLSVFLIRKITLNNYIKLKLKESRNNSVYLLLFCQAILASVEKDFFLHQVGILMFILGLYHNELVEIRSLVKGKNRRK